MVSSLMIVLGIVLGGSLYILGGDLFGGNNRAVVFNKGQLMFLPASKTKDKKQYTFKVNGVKITASPNGNEYFIKKNKSITFWEIKNNIAIPVNKKEKDLEVDDTNIQLQMIMALQQGEDKINTGWWDRNKEVVVGLTMIASGVIIYILSLKFASDVNPDNLNACINMAADIKNSSMTTENNINTLIDILSKNTPK